MGHSRLGLGGGGRRWLIAAALAVAVLGPSAALAGVYTEAKALNAQLLTHDSATAVLAQWCADHHLADRPTIVARRLSVDKPADAQVRALLRAAPGEAIRYRRVVLACGSHVLSTADNWYRPGRLTAAMNADLEGTDHPFGVVVKPLDFHRVRLSARLLVSRTHPTGDAIIRHEAMLETPDGTPFSLVIETYGREAVSPR